MTLSHQKVQSVKKISKWSSSKFKIFAHPRYYQETAKPQTGKYMKSMYLIKRTCNPNVHRILEI